MEYKTEIGPSGRRRRVPVDDADAGAQAAAEAQETAQEAPPADPPAQQPATDLLPPKTSTSKAKASTGRKRGRRAQAEYGDLAVGKPVKDKDVPAAPARARGSVYDPLLDAIVAQGQKSRGKTDWLPINPQGRTADSVQSGLTTAANSRGIKISTRIREVEGEKVVYARLVSE